MEELVGILFWTGFLCCLPLAAIGGPVGWIWYRNRQRREGSEAIGTALGLQPTARFKEMQWYEGRLSNGRLAAYLPIIFQYHHHDDQGTRRPGHVSAARIIVEVQRAEPLNVEAMRHQSWTERKRPFASFDEAFNSPNGSKLTSRQQQALIDFARQHPGTLWLGDRADASTDVFNAPEVMANATSFLLHEYVVKNPGPEEIQAKLAELSALASRFEMR